MELKELINILENKGYVSVEKKYDYRAFHNDFTQRIPHYIVKTKFESVYQKLREYDNYSQKGFIHSSKAECVTSYNYSTIIYIGEDVISFLEKYDEGKEKVKVPINLYEEDKLRCWIDEFTRYTYDYRNYSCNYTTYTYFINDDVRNERIRQAELKKQEVDDFIKSL